MRIAESAVAPARPGERIVESVVAPSGPPGGGGAPPVSPAESAASSSEEWRSEGTHRMRECRVCGKTDHWRRMLVDKHIMHASAAARVRAGTAADIPDVLSGKQCGEYVMTRAACIDEQRGIPLTLFSYKDHRFGCLSRASAVLLFNYEHISGFLSSNPHISNKLACLVRELLNLPHMKVIYAAFSILGIHLIEPFYSRTIATGATHTELGIFYRELHTSLQETKVEASVLTMENPIFPGVSKDLFESVKKSYGAKVVEVVREVAEEQVEDVVILINHMMPELAIVCSLPVP